MKIVNYQSTLFLAWKHQCGEIW